MPNATVLSHRNEVPTCFTVEIRPHISHLAEIHTGTARTYFLILFRS